MRHALKDLLHALDQPASDALSLIRRVDPYVGEIDKGDRVCHYAGEADKLLSSCVRLGYMQITKCTADELTFSDALVSSNKPKQREASSICLI